MFSKLLTLLREIFSKTKTQTQNKFKLSSKSKAILSSVKPDLHAVVYRALELSVIDFAVTDGLRSKERQAKLLKSGASKTMNSKHLTGDAVDLAAWVKGGVSWEWHHYVMINHAMQEAAKELDVKIKWGGEWEGFRDGCHWELA